MRLDRNTPRRLLTLLGALALATVTMFPTAGRAEDTQQPPPAAAPAAPQDQAAPMPGMAGCGENGVCCGACQEKAAMPSDDVAGGCPCQRAKRAQQGS
jgi:hypothetical protein